MKKETVLSVLKEIRDVLKPVTIPVKSEITTCGNLMWGKTLSDKMNWKNAMEACKELTIGGYKDWRLPTIKELISIIDYSKCKSAVIDGIKECQSDSYWSSTTVAGSTDYAWYVYFYVGYVSYDDKGSDYYVRPVRGGQ